ncbi:MAG: hypothetical protein ACXABY_25200 [Candidatus Thorarchaeota archaeon]
MDPIWYNVSTHVLDGLTCKTNYGSRYGCKREAAKGENNGPEDNWEIFTTLIEVKTLEEEK